MDNERIKQLVLIGALVLICGWFIYYGMFAQFDLVWKGLEIGFIFSFLRQCKIAVGFG